MSPPTKAPVKIIVDVHERQSGIAEALSELGAEIEVTPLPAGDYAVGAETLVERKRVLDLHGAILKGRLWPQLGKLRAACAYPYLLVEGTDIDRGPLHANAIRGACLAVIDLGIALLRTGYQRDSALWIHRLAIRCQELEPAAQRPAYAQRPRPKPGEETAEALLSAVPRNLDGVRSSAARPLRKRRRSPRGRTGWMARSAGDRTRARPSARADLSPQLKSVIVRGYATSSLTGRSGGPLSKPITKRTSSGSASRCNVATAV
jgi:ERCC4-type nuclease